MLILHRMTLLNCSWPKAPAHPVLSSEEVHVWCASLDQSTTQYVSLLSADEQAKAQRFHFEQDQRRFIVGRGLLRIILGCYLNLPPEKLQFEYRTHGKPMLSAESLQRTLCFNLSHSEEMALYAVTLNLEIGVDLEHVHPIPDVQQLAEQFFSPSERAELEALPPSQKLDAFFNGWTRKEAYLKARGDGMVYPLDQFSVSMSAEQPARLLEVKDGAQELSRWSLQTLTPAPSPGYVGALAVEGHSWRLAQWQIN